MRILIINGPNLNKIESRGAETYGNSSLSDIETNLITEFPEIEFSFVQSNLEGEIVTIIQNASNNFDGLLINPGGYTHTSVAIHDALFICSIPKIEVHLSNLAKREDFRQKSLTAINCDGSISGFKELSYLAGVFTLIKMIK